MSGLSTEAPESRRAHEESPLVLATVWLALGSNVGDRASQLRAAREALEAAGITITAASSIADTEPVGVTDQPRFLNQVLEATTSLPPKALLAKIKAIEKQLGRRPRGRWGPREIDIDILLYGKEVVDQPDLRIPHPELKNRKFLLSLLAELDPYILHPLEQQTVVALLRQNREP